MGFALPGLLRRATGTILATGVTAAGLLVPTTAPASAATSAVHDPTIASTDYPSISTGLVVDRASGS